MEWPDKQKELVIEGGKNERSGKTDERNGMSYIMLEWVPSSKYLQIPTICKILFYMP